MSEAEGLICSFQKDPATCCHLRSPSASTLKQSYWLKRMLRADCSKTALSSIFSFQSNEFVSNKLLMSFKISEFIYLNTCSKSEKKKLMLTTMRGNGFVISLLREGCLAWKQTGTGNHPCHGYGRQGSKPSLQDEEAQTRIHTERSGHGVIFLLGP